MTTNKPLALLLSPVLPLPGGSGRALRAWDWLQDLSKNHRVQVLVISRDGGALQLPEDYPAEAVWPINITDSIISRIYRKLGLLLPFLVLGSRQFMVDWPIADNCGNSLTPSLSKLGEQPVSRIVVFRFYLHEVAAIIHRQFPAAVLELDMDDLESTTRFSISTALWRMGRYWASWRSLAEALQYKLVEYTDLSGYRQIHVAAAEDCKSVTKHLGWDVTCRRNRLAAPPPCPPPLPGAELRILFVGTLNYPPNTEAVYFLVEKLLPLLKTLLRIPWRLCIVGRHAPPKLVKTLNLTPEIEFLADADDLEPIYASTDIVLVPLFAGGGTKLKTLEGFAHQRPVISTTQGVRGLHAVTGLHFLTAETAAEFADAIIRLNEEPLLSRQISAAGWALYRRDFRIEENSKSDAQ
jgi:glycosyltransferase involved in cell wall biosynthesis